MNDGMHANLGSIQDLEAEFARFYRVILDSLSEVRREVRQVTEEIEDRARELRREIAQLEDAIASADRDDDTSWERRRLAEAEEQLESVQRARRRLASSAAAYEQQARHVEHLATDHRVRSREFLNGAIDDLKSYLAKMPTSTFGGSTQASTSSTQIAASARNGGHIDLTAFPLPAGFVWVPIDRIDCSIETGGFENADRFAKVPREEMVRGYTVLQDDILPALTVHGATADTGFFRRLDATNARSYDNGAQRPFEAFFGDDHIYLTRKADTDAFNVTNGRHRIAVARELGWKAIPAKVGQG